MKTIVTDNQELLEVLTEQGISITCNEDMQMVISDEDAKLIPGLVEEYAPAASMDYTIEDMNTYDVVFNDDSNSNSKGFEASLDYCKDYIQTYNGTDESYFADYKGGTVSIMCNETEEEVYSELVK